MRIVVVIASRVWKCRLRRSEARTIDVPDMVLTAVSEFFQAEVMLCPGAQMSRHGP
jgi:hypothetical protein